MSQIFTLYRLQTLDSRLDAIQKRLQTIHATLDDQSALLAAREKQEKAHEALRQAQYVQKKAEDALQSARTKQSLNQQKLYGGRVTNPKALQDLEDEAAALKRRIAKLEDDLLEAMLAAESADEAFQTADSALQRAQEAASRQETELLDEKSRLEAEIHQEAARRDRLRKQLDADLLQQYDALRVSKKGLAVARVEGESCSACGAGLSPGLTQKARQETSLTFCPVCKRILYAG